MPSQKVDKRRKQKARLPNRYFNTDRTDPPISRATSNGSHSHKLSSITPGTSLSQSPSDTGSTRERPEIARTPTEIPKVYSSTSLWPTEEHVQPISAQKRGSPEPRGSPSSVPAKRSWDANSTMEISTVNDTRDGKAVQKNTKRKSVLAGYSLANLESAVAVSAAIGDGSAHATLHDECREEKGRLGDEIENLKHQLNASENVGKLKQQLNDSLTAHVTSLKERQDTLQEDLKHIRQQKDALSIENSSNHAKIMERATLIYQLSHSTNILQAYRELYTRLGDEIRPCIIHAMSLSFITNDKLDPPAALNKAKQKFREELEPAILHINEVDRLYLNDVPQQIESGGRDLLQIEAAPADEADEDDEDKEEDKEMEIVDPKTSREQTSEDRTQITPTRIPSPGSTESPLAQRPEISGTTSINQTSTSTTTPRTSESYTEGSTIELVTESTTSPATHISVTEQTENSTTKSNPIVQAQVQSGLTLPPGSFSRPLSNSQPERVAPVAHMRPNGNRTGARASTGAAMYSTQG